MTDTTPRTTEAEAIAALVIQPTTIQIESDENLLITPDGHGRTTITDLDPYKPAPRRQKGTVTAHDVDSFIAMVQRQYTDDTAIYLDVDYAVSRIQATAVINDGTPKSPGWRDHRIVFSPRHSDEWKAWVKHNDTPMTQTYFAAFLETHLTDIAQDEGTPAAAEVLTFVSKLSETRKVKYGSAVNLQNGMTQIEFIEDGDDATRGKLDVFKEFAIGVQPFFGGEGYKLRAFLRYRIDRNSGQIAFFYELQALSKTLAKATEGLINQINNELDDTPVYFGTPT